MQLDLESKIEMTKMLFTYAQTVRCAKRLPHLAAIAAQKEIEFKRELEDLEAQREQELPLNHAHAA